MKKLLCTILIIVCLLSLTIFCFAHPGRTDADGGHYNRSTGGYHYHHGYEAHQHPDGICPYDFNDNTERNNSAVIYRDDGSSILTDEVTTTTDWPKIEKETPNEENSFFIILRFALYSLSLSILPSVILFLIYSKVRYNATNKKPMTDEIFNKSYRIIIGITALLIFILLLKNYEYPKWSYESLDILDIINYLALSFFLSGFSVLLCDNLDVFTSLFRIFKSKNIAEAILITISTIINFDFLIMVVS